jgi:hypothetical protein
MFFLHMALGFERMAPLIGWSLVLTSQASATVPAFLGITGQWPAGTATAAAAGAGLAALLLLAGGLARRGRRSGTGGASSKAGYPASSGSRVPARFSTTISASTPATNITGTATSSPTAVSALPPISEVKLLTTR